MSTVAKPNTEKIELNQNHYFSSILNRNRSSIYRHKKEERGSWCGWQTDRGRWLAPRGRRASSWRRSGSVLVQGTWSVKAATCAVDSRVLRPSHSQSMWWTSQPRRQSAPRMRKRHHQQQHQRQQLRQRQHSFSLDVTSRHTPAAVSQPLVISSATLYTPHHSNHWRNKTLLRFLMFLFFCVFTLKTFARIFNQKPFWETSIMHHFVSAFSITQRRSSVS